MHVRILAFLVALGAAGCVSAKAAAPPHRQAQIGALAAVRSAEEAVSENPAPGAEERLRLAAHDFRKGRSMVARGELEVAQLYFERSQANAAVAVARAEAAKAEDKLERAQAGPMEERTIEQRPIERRPIEEPTLEEPTIEEGG